MGNKQAGMACTHVANDSGKTLRSVAVEVSPDDFPSGGTDISNDSVEPFYYALGGVYLFFKINGNWQRAYVKHDRSVIVKKGPTLYYAKYGSLWKKDPKESSISYRQVKEPNKAGKFILDSIANM
eukprot:129634_1